MNKMLLALSYAFCWGVGVTLTKIALAEIAPTSLLMIQLSVSVLFLAAARYWRDRKLPFGWKNIKQGIAGVFEPGLTYTIGIFGVNLTTASNAALIGATEVILTLLFAAVFLREKLTRLKLLLAGTSFAGVALLILKGAEGASNASLLGDLLILVSTVFAVVYVLVSKRQVSTVDPLRLTASQQFVGLLVTVFCAGILSLMNSRFEINFAGIPFQFWLLAVVSGLMSYALAFLIYLIALQNVPASYAAFYIALIPVFGVASAIVLLGEQPSLTQGIGAILVIGSSYMVNRFKAA